MTQPMINCDKGFKLSIIILSVILQSSLKVFAFNLPANQRHRILTTGLTGIMDEQSVKPKKTKPSKRKNSPRNQSTNGNESSNDLVEFQNSAEQVGAHSKRKKATEPQRITEKDELPKLWNEQESLLKTGSYSKS